MVIIHKPNKHPAPPAGRFKLIAPGAFFALWSVFLVQCTLFFSKESPSFSTPLITKNNDLPSNNDNPTQFLKSVQKNVDPPVQDAIYELYHKVTAERLHTIAEKHRTHYDSATPFPHIAIDNLFPDAIIQEVIREHPESSVASNGCIPGIQCFKTPKQNLKSAITQEDKMGMYTRVLFSFMKSSIFTTFLEELTGIKNILPDPHFRGSGLHFTGPGGNLDVHADFNKYQGYDLDRRVSHYWEDKCLFVDLCVHPRTF